jgi:hypothetical protein
MLLRGLYLLAPALNLTAWGEFTTCLRVRADTCNNSGMHDVRHANKFGIVVYDWSNAKAIWVRKH